MLQSCVQILFGKDIGTIVRLEGKECQFFRVHSSVFVNLQCFYQKFLANCCYVLAGDDGLNGLSLYFPQQFFLAFGSPGGVVEQHLVEDDSERPDIRFEGVLVFPERFGGHVERGAHIVAIGFSKLLGSDAKTEISYFGCPVLHHEDVGRFQVPVDDPLLLELEVALDDLLHEGDNLSFLEGLFDGFAEIGVAEFGDEVGVVFGGEDVVEGEDVGQVLELLEDVDFGVEEGAVDLVFELLEVDDFDGDGLVWIGGRVLVSSLRPL